MYLKTRADGPGILYTWCILCWQSAVCHLQTWHLHLLDINRVHVRATSTLNCYLLCSFLISRGNVSGLLQLSALEKYLRRCLDFLDQASFEHITISKEVSVLSSDCDTPTLKPKVPMSMFLGHGGNRVGLEENMPWPKAPCSILLLFKGIQGSSRGPCDGLLICLVQWETQCTCYHLLRTRIRCLSRGRPLTTSDGLVKYKSRAVLR